MTIPDEGTPGSVAAFWDSRHAQGADHDNFLAHHLVHAYVSLRAFGDLTSHMDAVIAEIRTRTRPGARIFSPGCGAAKKELAMAQRLPDRHFVAADIAEQALQQGRSEAERLGVRNLELVRADFNHLALEPTSFDIVTGLGAVHHVEALEHFWQQCRRALRPEGVVLAQEYVGPNRLQWTDVQVEAANRALHDLVPAEHKTHHQRVVPVPLAEIMAIDPSEAVRSRDILPTCRSAGFRIVGYAGAGCALLQPVLMYQIATYDPRNWDHNLVLTTLFREEDRLMREGVIGDDFAMFIAAP